MTAIHGFSIIEKRDGLRFQHFPKRSTVKTYDLVKCRVMDLARDRRLKHLPTREFEIWDGINPISRIIIGKGVYRETPYLLQPTHWRERVGYERDHQLAVRNRIKNQSVGRKRGDISEWIKAGPMDRVLCTKGNTESYKKEEKIITRTMGMTSKPFECVSPWVKEFREYVKKPTINL